MAYKTGTKRDGEKQTLNRATKPRILWGAMIIHVREEHDTWKEKSSENS